MIKKIKQFFSSKLKPYEVFFINDKRPATIKSSVAEITIYEDGKVKVKPLI